MKKAFLDVDVTGVCSIIYQCTGCADTSGHCCSRYEVTISDTELNNIIQYLPRAAELCPSLKLHDSFDNVFEELSRGLYAIDTGNDGTCLFAYPCEAKLLCSLHTIALRQGIPLRKVKPLSCILWPLALFEGETTILTIDEEAFRFECVQPNIKNGPVICPSIAENAGNAFGKAFRTELEQHAAGGAGWARIPLL